MSGHPLPSRSLDYRNRPFDLSLEKYVEGVRAVHLGGRYTRVDGPDTVVTGGYGGLMEAASRGAADTWWW